VRVLGIAGSPRRGGNTDLLLDEVMKGAKSKGAKVKTIVLNDLDISPCQHCDACFEAGVCKVKDDMQMVYQEMEKADRIVLASPVHFLGLTAQMKAMIDRGQALWARKYILEKPPAGRRAGKKGLIHRRRRHEAGSSLRALAGDGQGIFQGHRCRIRRRPALPWHRRKRRYKKAPHRP